MDILGFRLHWVRPCEAAGNVPTPSLVIMEPRIYFRLPFHGCELEAPDKGSIEGIVNAHINLSFHLPSHGPTACSSPP